MRKIAIIASLLLFSTIGWTQTGTLIGQLSQSEDSAPAADMKVVISGTSLNSVSDEAGNFQINDIPYGNQVVLFVEDGYEKKRLEVYIIPEEITDLGKVIIPIFQDEDASEELATIVLQDQDFDGQGSGNISGLLNAGGDIFLRSTRFSWGTRRFRYRGLDSRNTEVFLNGISVNELEFGRPTWFLWSGLNDVTRASTRQYGIVPIEFGFGGLIGGTSLDMRASSQWKQTKASISAANATYTQRYMATHSTGWMENGWAFSVSGSRRVSQEGYIDGTFYDSWGYYAAASKKLGKHHELHITTFGTPNKRGANNASVPEMYELAGSNYYNPNWGYQEGKKRNSRVKHGFTPILLLNHDVKLKNGGKITNAVSLQRGTSGGTALDWADAQNPAPDYYRRLPSFAEEGDVRDRIAAELRNSEELRQMDWDAFYTANRLNAVTVENADGIIGNTVSGNRAQYVLEDRRYDTKSFDYRTSIAVPLSDKLSLQGGITVRSQTKNNFKLVHDLLGADFWLDIDRFSQGEPGLPDNAEINNLDRANQISRVGDTIGYSYDTQLRKAGIWWQVQGTSDKIDYFFAATGSRSIMWRNGNFRNGRFPNSSFGASPKAEFTNYGMKAGLTYKINGRNYIYLNGMSQTRAPFARNAFIAPRTRNDFVPDLKNEQLQGAELTYQWRSPGLKLRAGAYINEIKDQVETRSFFIDDGVGSNQGLFFGNYVSTNIDSRHLGVELAGEYQILAGLRVNAAASIGQYYYTDRFLAQVSVDNSSELIFEDRVIYSKNFFVDQTPQHALKAGLSYRGKKFWSLWLDVSYLSNQYIDFNPERRTVDAVSYNNGGFVERGSQLWQDIIYQEKRPGVVLVDISGRKSFKIGKNFLVFNIGINNALNNTNYTTGGFEQLRFDYLEKDVDRFQTRYFNGLGLTYFANVSFQLR